ncbi:MAG: DUF4230 domain-containing protein [Saprospiraceae bacterium]|nr:DUF4230 domain-containing protein [Saprospiraceae bacterium]
MRFIYGAIVVLAFLSGFYLCKKLSSISNNETNQSTVLLERIKEVFKIVYVEAQFSELYSHKDYTWIDLSPFRKSAIVRVQAKVTAGVNMDSAKIEIQEKTKTIHLIFNSQPVILSIDHKLDYYDLQQGSFNYFNSEELTKMQEQARQLILKKAMESDLLSRANQKRIDMTNTLDQFVNSMGWKLIVEEIPSHKYFKQ